MRRSRSSWSHTTVGLVSFVVLVGALAGCSAPESVSTRGTSDSLSVRAEATLDAASVPDGTGGEELGAQSSLDELGTEEVDDLLVKKTNAYMARCLEAAGMRAGQYDRVDSFYEDVGSSAQAHGITFDRAQIALETLTGASEPPTVPAASGPNDQLPDEEHQQRSELCWSFAAQYVPDPFAPVGGEGAVQVGENPFGDVFKRADADPRVVAAREAEAECLAALGVPERTTVALAQRISDGVAAVSLKLETGEITQAEAERQFERLAAVEAQIGPAASECFDAFDAVRTSVANEIANDVASVNAEAFAEQEVATRKLFDELAALDVAALPLPPG